jgi:hypothetical protein
MLKSENPVTASTITDPFAITWSTCHSISTVCFNTSAVVKSLKGPWAGHIDWEAASRINRRLSAPLLANSSVISQFFRVHLAT